MRNLVGWKLRGRVHTLRTEHADWDNVHRIWLPPQSTTLITFHPDGQVSDEERRNPDRSLTQSHSIYDEKGRLIEEQWRKDNEPPFRIVHVYDDDGRLSEMFHISKEGHSRLAEQHQYDATGRKTKVQFFDPAAGQSAGYGAEGSQLGYPAANATTCTTLYDDQQLPYEATCRDANGAVVLTVEITRDERGQVVREVAHFGAESPFAKGVADIEDDEREQLAAVLAQAFSDVDSKFTYDEKGRMIEQTTRMGTMSEHRTTRMYDDEDHDEPVATSGLRTTRAAHMSESGEVQTTEEEPVTSENRFEFQYDARGNWTERVGLYRRAATEEFQRSHIERRTITYYD